MARAEITVTRHEAEYRWEARVEGRTLTGSFGLGGGEQAAQASAWMAAARAVYRLVAGFEGDA